MAQLVIDLTGSGGLAPNYYGDLNDTVAAPNLRYVGSGSQMADGVFDPLRLNGYMSPANDTMTNISTTLTAEPIARAYDSKSDQLYIAENGTHIALLAGLDATTSTEPVTIAGTMRDLELYMINGENAILYTYHYSQAVAGTTTALGFISTDPSRGMFSLVGDVYNSGVATNDELMAPIGVTTTQAMAQKFRVQDTILPSDGTITGVRLRLKNPVGGTTQAWTMRIGIQTDSGGVPSGTFVTGGFVDVSPNTIEGSYDYLYVKFTAPVVLSFGTTYHLVLVPTVPAQLTGTTGMYWLRTDSNNGIYNNGAAERYNGSTTTWSTIDTTETFDFALIRNESIVLVTSSNVAGVFALNDRDNTSVFLVKADNGFLYWFVDSQIHKFDGGTTGGPHGAFTPQVLVFPNFLKCIDAVDTNSLMYIGVQSSDPFTVADTRTFSADTMGIYVWDRQSTVVSTRNFIPIYGAREIRKLFVSPNGDVRIITISDSGYTEIRGISNNKCIVLQTLGRNAYPRYRDSVDILGGMTVWLGATGTMYTYGKMPGGTTEQAWKIGSITNQLSGSLVSSGIIYVGGKQPTTPLDQVMVSWKDTGNRFKRWFPHGIGTLNSTAQIGNIGKVYTLVNHFPYLCTLQHINITVAPHGAAGDTTVVGTIRFYVNNSATEFMHKDVTRDDLVKGFLSYEINKPFVNSLQMSFEWNTTQTLGTNDLNPAFAVVTYKASNART